MSMSELLNKEALELLKEVVDIRAYQHKPSIANQGQCLDGYSALANYNGLADKIEIFLRKTTCQ